MLHGLALYSEDLRGTSELRDADLRSLEDIPGILNVKRAGGEGREISFCFDLDEATSAFPDKWKHILDTDQGIPASERFCQDLIKLSGRMGPLLMLSQNP